MHTPQCDKPGLTQLLWLTKVGEPPGDPNHNIGYDSDVIEICPACNGATLEALRHDCFDWEEVHDQYEWYEFAPEDGVRLRAIAATCDQPLNPFCDCAAHKSLRTSAQQLPRSSWDTIFEPAQHRHIVTVTDGAKPKLTLVRTGVELAKPPAPPPDQPKAPDTEAVGFIFLAWPAAFAAFLWLWFRFVKLPWIVDAIVAFLAIPATFVVAGMVLAGVKVLRSSKRTN